MKPHESGSERPEAVGIRRSRPPSLMAQAMSSKISSPSASAFSHSASYAGHGIAWCGGAEWTGIQTQQVCVGGMGGRRACHGGA